VVQRQPDAGAVRDLKVLGQIGMHTAQRTENGTAAARRAVAGVSMIELLCVITIITILASLLLPTVMRAFTKVRGMAQEWEADEVLYLLTSETRRYCAAHPQYAFPTKSGFVQQCGFAPKPMDWVLAPATEFVPFGFQDDTNKIVLTFHIGPKRATVYAFSKGELTITPQGR
jgi:prepilin-type N-terminal cleavage/methylation domain-containing protein